MADHQRQAAENQAARMASALEKIRSRGDVAAKTFGALATTALTAVGLTKIADLFPLPPSGRALLWAWIAVAGFVGIAAAAALLTGRLWKLNAPIFTTSDRSIMEKDYSPRELELIDRAYDETASLNRPGDWEEKHPKQTYTLWDYEQKGFTERNAEKAATIRAEVRATQARAGVLVVRHRATRAATGLGTWLIAGLFVAGLVGFAAGTDWLAAERDDTRIAQAKSCGDAQKAIADAKITGVRIPGFCGSPAPAATGTSSSPQAIQEKATTVAALAAQWKDCITRAKQPLDVETCRTTLHWVQQVAAGPPPPPP